MHGNTINAYPTWKCKEQDPRKVGEDVLSHMPCDCVEAKARPNARTSGWRAGISCSSPAVEVPRCAVYTVARGIFGDSKIVHAALLAPHDVKEVRSPGTTSNPHKRNNHENLGAIVFYST
ncbi:Uncharacterized protein Fot_42811 [Forsythia ovata]|uniref:Uncharacterized protein n=1 Tax=Forsythia ovata TaxID=205694 RepID=A0ABD1RR49_9LAMI